MSPLGSSRLGSAPVGSSSGSGGGLGSLPPNVPSLLCDLDLLSEIQRALLEPIINGGQSWASEVWTRAEVLDALNDAIRRLVRTTHLIVLRTEIAVPAGTLSIALPDDWLATATGVWRDTATNSRTPLGPVDAFEADTALQGWETTTGTPIAIADLDRGTVTTHLVPTPNADGVLELLYIPRPTTVTGSCTGLPIPDEFWSAEKYGTLGRLLSKVGRLQDPARVSYCASRVQVATIAANVLLGGWA